MRLRFAVALAAVAAAWYVIRPEQASNVARVGDLAGAEARAEEPRWSRSTPPPALPPAEPGEPGGGARDEVGGRIGVRIDRELSWSHGTPRWTPTIGQLEAAVDVAAEPPPPEPPAVEDRDPAPVLARGDLILERRHPFERGPSGDREGSVEVPVEQPAPDEAAAVSFSCGGGTSNNVYYVEGIDLTGLTFD